MKSIETTASFPIQFRPSYISTATACCQGTTPAFNHGLSTFFPAHGKQCFSCKIPSFIVNDNLWKNNYLESDHESRLLENVSSVTSVDELEARRSLGVNHILNSLRYKRDADLNSKRESEIDQNKEFGKKHASSSQSSSSSNTATAAASDSKTNAAATASSSNKPRIATTTIHVPDVFDSMEHVSSVMKVLILNYNKLSLMKSLGVLSVDQVETSSLNLESANAKEDSNEETHIEGSRMKRPLSPRHHTAVILSDKSEQQHDVSSSSSSSIAKVARISSRSSMSDSLESKPNNDSDDYDRLNDRRKRVCRKEKKPTQTSAETEALDGLLTMIKENSQIVAASTHSNDVQSKSSPSTSSHDNNEKTSANKESTAANSAQVAVNNLDNLHIQEDLISPKLGPQLAKSRMDWDNSMSKDQDNDESGDYGSTESHSGYSSSSDHGAIVPPRRWTPEEDSLLLAAVSKYNGKNWKAIASYVPGRNHVQCLQRWRKVLDPSVIKGHWSAEEDNKLIEIVSSTKFQNWGKVSVQIPGRTAKQCRERYYNYLDPSLSKDPWTEEEDNFVLQFQRDMGNHWSEIARRLQGRSENQVKVRFKLLQRRMKRDEGKITEISL